jgi:cytoskeletal protein CcmA (bactofilin family)
LPADADRRDDHQVRERDDEGDDAMPSDVDTMRDDVGSGSVRCARRGPGSRRVRRRGVALAALLALSVLLGAPVAAAQDAPVAAAQDVRLRGKVRTGSEVVVPAGETVRGDLYASGGLVRVEGTVLGDLVAAGGQVQVPGQIRGDVTAAGATVDISGRIGGDARVAAGRVTVGGPVAEDLVVGAGQVTLTPSATVGQDLVFGAGQMTVDGRVIGSVLGSTGSYTCHGSVGGSEDVRVERPQRKPAAPTLGDRILHGVQRLIAVLAVAALLLWLLPRLLTGAAAAVRRRPLTSLGVGLLGLVAAVVTAIAVPVVAVLLAVVLGLLGLGGLVALVLAAAATALVVLGFLLFVVVAFVAPPWSGWPSAGSSSARGQPRGAGSRSPSACSSSSSSPRSRWSAAGSASSSSCSAWAR